MLPLVPLQALQWEQGSLGSWSSPEVCPNSEHKEGPVLPAPQPRIFGDDKGQPKAPSPPIQPKDLSSHLVLPHPVAKLPEQEKG